MIIGMQQLNNCNSHEQQYYAHVYYPHHQTYIISQMVLLEVFQL